QLRETRKFRESDQWKAFQNIKDNLRMMLDYLIPIFTQLNDDKFSSIIEEIINTRKTNICIQRKLLDLLILIFFQLNDDDLVLDNKGEIISTYLQKKAHEFVDASLYKPNNTIGSLELKNKNLNYKIQSLKRNKFTTNALLRSFSIKVARAKNSKQKQISKIRSAIRKANKIRLAQFQRVANKLFKINNKEYNAKFVKLAADISNIDQTSIYATVECTKIIYQILTREMPQHWVTPLTLS
ncbi:36453_t:CDS:2, partial [Racocetra persica]